MRVFYSPVLLAIVLFFLFSSKAQSQVTISAGSYIIKMDANFNSVTSGGLRPYGMVHELIKYYKVPVLWIVRDNKRKDEVDYTINGVAYRGGLFVIPSIYVTGPVQTAITQWTGTTSVTSSNGYTRGLVTANAITSPYTFKGANIDTLKVAPLWTLDLQNGSLAQPFFTNAGIPPSQYNLVAPAQLGACNDIFVLPHTSAVWSTYGNLYNWNLTYKGAIWTGCHAVSALANMYNPANISQQTNFLVNKVTSGGNYIAPVPGSTNYAQNSLVLWGNHGNGTSPYNTNVSPVPPPQTGNVAPPDDWVSQFIGLPDAASQNGSEQIYLPVLGGSWLSTTQIITYDPTQADVPSKSSGAAVVIAYGRGLGDPNRGLVMYEAGHSLNKGTAGDVAAQRAFFNWSFVAVKEKAVQVSDIQGIPADGKVYTSTQLSLSASSPVGSNLVSYAWTCVKVSDGSVIGSFSPNNSSNASTTVFTPGAVAAPTPVIISVTVTDACGRSTTSVHTSTIMPPPHSPTPQGDIATIQTQCIEPGMSTTINVTSNDSDPEGNLNTSSVLLQNPAVPGQYGTSFTVTDVGTWTTDGTNVTFMPAQNFYGMASITYQICDNTPNTGTAPFLGPLCATAVVTVSVGSPDVHGCFPGSAWDIVGTANAIAQTNSGVNNPDNALGSTDYDPASSATYAILSNNTNILTLDFGSAFTPPNYDTTVVYFASGIEGSSVTAAISFSTDGVNFTSVGTFSTSSNVNGTSVRFVLPSGGLRYIRIQRSAGTASIWVDAAELENWDCTSAKLAANQDNVSVSEDLPVTINVTANDNNPGNLPLTLTIVSQPANGIVSINTDNTITYLNNTDYPSGGNATDQFAYQVCNTQGSCSSATVTINIKDDGCAGIGQYRPIDVGNPVTVTFTGITETIDAQIREDGGNATTNFGNAATTEIGKKIGNRRRFLLAIPDAQYQAKIPGTAIIQSATVRLTVTGGDNAKYKMSTYRIIGDPMWNEGQVTWRIRATGFNWTTQGSDFVSGALSSLYIARGTAPNNGANGSQPIFDVTNAVTQWQNNIATNRGIMIGQSVDSTQVDKRLTFGTSENGTVANRPLFTITYVLPLPCQAIPNRAPLANPDNASTVVAQPVTIIVLNNDKDADAGATLAIQSASMVSPSKGTLVVSGTTLNYTPNNSSLIPRVDTIQYVVSDGSLTDVAYIYVNVGAAAPQVNADFSQALSGIQQVIDLHNNTNPAGADNDPNNYILADAVVIRSPANGTYTLSGNTLTYTPNAGWYGKDTMIYQRTQVPPGCDTGLSDTALVVFTVLNQSPVARDTTLQVTECRPLNFSVNSYTDPEGEKGTIVFDGTVSHGTLTSNPDGTYTYTPENGFTGIDFVQYHVTDPGGLSSGIGTITFNIVAPAANQAPDVVDDSFNITTGDGVGFANQDLYVDVLFNDSDPEGDQLVVSLNSGLLAPAHGTVSVLQNGTILYKPDGTFTGTDQFQYRVCDSLPPSASVCPQPASQCGVATVTVLIQAAPPLPVTFGKFTATPVENTVRLNWTTYTEQNNTGFDVQYSVNGSVWGKIGFVQTKANQGNSVALLQYQFLHVTPSAGTNYYRLRQIDNDGRSEYSHVNMVRLDKKQQVSINPNPAKDFVRVQGLTGKETIWIYNAAGKLVKKILTKNEIETIELNALAAGLYQLVIFNGTTTVASIQMIKMR